MKIDTENYPFLDCCLDAAAVVFCWMTVSIFLALV